MSTELLAGNVAKITRTFRAVDGSAINPSTCTAWVLKHDGTKTALVVTPAYSDADKALTVAVNVEAPDDTPRARWTVTFDVAGILEASDEEAVFIRARRSPTPPT